MPTRTTNYPNCPCCGSEAEPISCGGYEIPATLYAAIAVYFTDWPSGANDDECLIEVELNFVEIEDYDPLDHQSIIPGTNSDSCCYGYWVGEFDCCGTTHRLLFWRGDTGLNGVCTWHVAFQYDNGSGFTNLWQVNGIESSFAPPMYYDREPSSALEFPGVTVCGNTAEAFDTFAFGVEITG